MSDEQQPPRPRYGEYAPGYTPPAPRDAEPDAPTGQPEGTPSSTSPPWGPPAWQAAPQQPDTASHSPSAQPWTAKPARPRRTWDVVLTIVLLVLGVVGTVIAVGYAALLSNPELLDQALRQQGQGDFEGTIGNAPTIIVVTHVVLLVLAIGLSILALVKRWVAFWIPLTAGVIGAVIFWVTIILVLATDPSFAQSAG